MEIDELKTRLQQHFTDGLVTIIGSGLSCAEGLPGMGELAKHLCDNIPDLLTGDDLIEWNALSPEINTIGLEAALLKKVPSLKVEQAISKITGLFIATQEQAVFEEVFAGERTLRLTRLIPHLIKPTTGLPIVTTNYDRLVELAVEEAQLGTDTMFTGRYAGLLNEKESRLGFCRKVTFHKKSAIYHFKPRALILKPHGSLDWYLRNGTPVFHSGILKEATRLIITPGHNKFRNGYDSPFDHHRNRANDVIDKASRYLILGYGFNDDHLETHLSPAIKSGKPTLLITRSLSIKAEELAKTYANVIAIEHKVNNGIEGTNIICDKANQFIDFNLWDLKEFISGVLEP